MTLPTATGDLGARRARALGDDTRRAVLDHLRAGPLDVRTLAERLGLHPNAVRQHLAVLCHADLVADERERSAGRVGRPRTLYRPASAGCPFAGAPGAGCPDPDTTPIRTLTTTGAPR